MFPQSKMQRNLFEPSLSRELWVITVLTSDRQQFTAILYYKGILIRNKLSDHIVFLWVYNNIIINSYINYIDKIIWWYITYLLYNKKSNFMNLGGLYILYLIMGKKRRKSGLNTYGIYPFSYSLIRKLEMIIDKV